MHLFTIGHSTRTFEEFYGLLKEHDIQDYELVRNVIESLIKEDKLEKNEGGS